MIALFVGFALVVVAASCLTALARPRGAVAFVLGVGVVGFAEIVALSHSLSFVDAYERDWLLAALAAAAAASVAAGAIVRPPWPSFRRLAVLRDVLGDRVVAMLAVVVAVETCYVLALALVTPPNDIDALTYHLMRGALWIQQQAVAPVGGIADTRIDEFPPDADILQAATMLLSGSARFAQLVALAALVAATLAIYGLASRIGLDRRRAAFGALLFPTLPIVALQASTAMTDIVVAGLVATAAFFLLGRSPGELGLACLTIALLIGTKVTGLLALPLLLAIALLTLRGRRLVLALAGGAAACLVGGAWFAVNLHAGRGLSGPSGNKRAAPTTVSRRWSRAPHDMRSRPLSSRGPRARRAPLPRRRREHRGGRARPRAAGRRPDRSRRSPRFRSSRSRSRTFSTGSGGAPSSSSGTAA